MEAEGLVRSYCGVFMDVQRNRNGGCRIIGCAPVVLALALLAVTLADARTPARAVLALAPLAVMLADAGGHTAGPSSCSRSCGGYADRCWCGPPQSLHWLLCRLCAQMRLPPHSTHLLLRRLCGLFFCTYRSTAQWLLNKYQ